MIAKTYVSEVGKGLDEVDTIDVEVVELDTKRGRQVRICTPYADDIQLHLVKGKLQVRYFSEKGTPIRHTVGLQTDEIPF
jgi:hypothetical protein